MIILYRSTLLLLFVLSFNLTQAQYYYLPFIDAGENPKGLNTDIEQGTTTGWVNVTSTVTPTSPKWSSTVTIPFSFSFNGTGFTKYKISTSGVLTFDLPAATAPADANVALPSALIPDNSICAWGLKATSSNDIIRTKTFGATPNRQHWVQFCSYTSPGYTSSGSIWTYWAIVLEETSNRIYIVDQRTAGMTLSLTLGIQINSSTAFQVSGSPNIDSHANVNAYDDPSDNSYYEFRPGTQSSWNFASINASAPEFILKGNTANISGKLSNFGSSTVNTLNLNYSVNGAAAVTMSKTGLNIASGSSYNFSFNYPVPASFGAYAMKIWASALNGNTDQDHNDDTISVLINALSFIPPKKVLIEEATGSWCGYCPDGALIVDDILQSESNVIALTLHNNDGMAFTNGNTVNTTYAQGYPNGYVDRHLFSGEPTVGTSRSSWTTLVNTRISEIVPAYVTVTSSYNSGTRVVTATVSAVFFGNITGDFRPNLYVVEDSVTGTGSNFDQVNYYSSSSAAAGGSTHPLYNKPNPITGYKHRHVARAMLGGSWGNTGVIPATTSNGTKYSKSYSYTIPSTINDSRVKLVAIVQRYSADINKRDIFNAQECTLGGSSGNSAMAVKEYAEKNFNSLAVYPNPNEGLCTIDYVINTHSIVKVSIVNIFGEQVRAYDLGMQTAGAHNVKFNGENLPAGVYFVSLASDNDQISRKIVISK